MNNCRSEDKIPVKITNLDRYTDFRVTLYKIPFKDVDAKDEYYRKTE